MAVTAVGPNVILELNIGRSPRAGFVGYPSHNVEQLGRAPVGR